MVEHGKKRVSPEQALALAYAVDGDDVSFVTAALQEQVDALGLPWTVSVKR
jgi:hypothetical protein